MLYSATPIKYGYGQDSRFEGWNDYSGGIINAYNADNADNKEIAFLYRNPHPDVPISEIQVRFDFYGVSPGGTQSIVAFNNDVPAGSYSQLIATTSYTNSGSYSSGTASPVLRTSSPMLCGEYITIRFYGNYSHYGVSNSRGIGIQPPDVVVSVSPDVVYADNPITINFENRLDDTLLVSIGRNYTTLDSFETNQDSATYTCPSSWLDGYSGESVQLWVRAERKNDNSDSFGSSWFVLQKRTPNVVSIIGPRSETFDGGEQINFGWTSTGDGTQVGAELDWSLDRIEWTSLARISGNTEIFKSDPATFPPNRIYWRVRVLNNLGVWSEYDSANFTIRYSATSYVEPLNSPTGGNVNKSVTITFSCILRADGVPYQPFSVSSATFYWRSRATNPYTQVSMTPDGSNASVTIAANTFPTGSIDWYISATDNLSATTQTSVYTISTLASAIEARPVSPVNTVEISNDNITFTWHFASTSGDPQNGAEVKYSLDGETWTTLPRVSGTNTSVTVPPNTFHSGTVYWQVRAFNSAGNAGDWSAIVQFVAFGAPETPSVTADAVPFATIRWQSDGQVSYEVEVDGTVYGPFLGTEKAYELYDYLADGSHTARVRVLGSADLWSSWGETLFNVNNVPTSTLTLNARTDVDTELTWTGGSGNYYVYRDGKLIARTNAQSFADRTALGVHEYKVVERLASGNYNISTALTRTMEVQYMHIASLDGGDWIKILHTLKDSSDPSYDYSALAEFNHMDSSEYPVVSVGPYLDENARYSAVFLYTEEDEHRRFRALFRKPVILKTSDDVVMIGFLDAWERKPKTSRGTKYYTAYTFKLQRIDWEDFIDDTQ